MANRAVQLRRGTTAEHTTFTGLLAEITIDTDKDTIVVHDGATVGGFPLATYAEFAAHVADSANPHNVTRAQLNVDTTDNVTFAQVTATAGLVTSGATAAEHWDATIGSGAGVRFVTVRDGSGVVGGIRGNNFDQAGGGDLDFDGWSNVTVGGSRVLTVSDEGSGNGIDADTLDGQEGAYYSDITARLGYTPVDTAGDTMTGMLIIDPIFGDGIRLGDDNWIGTSDGSGYWNFRCSVDSSDNIAGSGNGGSRLRFHNDGDFVQFDLDYATQPGNPISPTFTLTMDSVNNELRCTGDVVAFSSDARLKTNYKDIDSALFKASKIRAIEFDWDADAAEEAGFHYTRPHDIGVLAQEVQAVLPDAVRPAPFNKDYLTVRYDRLTVLNLAAIHELTDENEQLKAKVDSLESQIEALKEAVFGGK